MVNRIRTVVFTLVVLSVPASLLNLGCGDECHEGDCDEDGGGTSGGQGGGSDGGGAGW